MHTTAKSGLTHLVFISALVAAFTGPVQAETSTDESETRFSRIAKDAWIAGKLETAYILNEHLNPFDIDIEVEDGVITLEGAVETDIQKELAGMIAKGIKGAKDVRNDIAVNTGKQAAGNNGQANGKPPEFARWVSDATISAVVKTKLAANEHIHSLDIDVSTHNGVVTLDGKVPSPEARTLAEVIASNSHNVRKVENRLAVN